MDYHKLGKRIKEERIKQNLTQERLAEASNLSSIHISHVETGSTKLSLEALINICTALKVTPDFLLLDSIYSSKEYLKDEIAVLLKDCTDKEINIISKLIKLYMQER